MGKQQATLANAAVAATLGGKSTGKVNKWDKWSNAAAGGGEEAAGAGAAGGKKKGAGGKKAAGGKKGAAAAAAAAAGDSEGGGAEGEGSDAADGKLERAGSAKVRRCACPGCLPWACRRLVLHPSSCMKLWQLGQRPPGLGPLRWPNNSSQSSLCAALRAGACAQPPDGRRLSRG